jgi:hypothetical protein
MPALHRRLLPGTSRLAALLAAVLLTIGLPYPALAQFHPNHPQVQAMVNKALNYLGARGTSGTGYQALVALTFCKAKQYDHLRVGQGVSAVQSAIRGGFREDRYTNAVSILLMKELIEEGKGDYMKELNILVDHLLATQRAEGGWGYASGQTGDTSMTQYGVLALWESQGVGIETPAEAWERVAAWLMRTQDPSGGFGYQGNDPGSFNLTAQSDVRHSLSAAGLGSLYIILDRSQIRAEKRDDVNSSFKPVNEGLAERQRGGLNVNKEVMQAAIGRGNAWFDRNYRIPGTPYPMYYLYALERMKSFQELATGNPPEQSPGWYNDGVNWLAKTVGPDGGWKEDLGEEVDTCMAVLFLVRSSQKSIKKRLERYGAGIQQGSRGLGQNLDGGDIIADELGIRRKPLSGPFEELMKSLGDPQYQDLEAAAEGVRNALENVDQATLASHVAEFQKLVKGQNAEVRKTAIEGLALNRNLDNVPILIYALTDPDPIVLEKAREALMKIARRFEPVPIRSATPQAARAEEIAWWKEWYLNIRPDAVFEN